MGQNGIVIPNWTKVSEVELVYKTKIKSSERPIIRKSEDIYPLLLDCWDMNRIELQEEFKVLLLNKANRVLGIYPLSTGGISGTVADPKLIFMAAIKSGASCLILSHNHPSGNLKPSRADQELTARITTAASLLDIRVLDHIIISTEGYFSFADEGLI